MHAGQYGEVEHERHLNGLCSYPLCANKPAAPYRAQKRFQISARAKTIKEVEGNAEEGFCSKRCRIKSQWVRENLGSEAAWLRGKVAPLELLEDLEDRKELVWEGGKNGQYKRLKPSIDAVTGTGTGTDVATTASAVNANNDDNCRDDVNMEGSTPPFKPAPASSNTGAHSHAPPDQADNGALPGDTPEPKKVLRSEETVSAPSRSPGASRPALGTRHDPTTPAQDYGSGSLTTPVTRSRPTGTQGRTGTDTRTGVATGGSGAGTGAAAPTNAPRASMAAPPEVNDLLDSLVIQEHDTAHETPAPPTLNAPVRVPKPLSAASARKARNTSSMIDGANSKLAQSVLTAHRQMKPVLQDEGSSDEGEGYREEEWEKAMGWGEGAELDAMFEEARKARELAS